MWVNFEMTVEAQKFNVFNSKYETLFTVIHEANIKDEGYLEMKIKTNTARTKENI